MEYLNSDFFLRVFTLALWVGALLTYIRYILVAKTADEKDMRRWHSLIIISVIVHAIVFYIALLMADFNNQLLSFHPGWSNVLRIHTATALIIHKLLRTAMSDIQDC